MIVRALLAVALLGSAMGAGAADAPFVWQVKGPKATHYLVGSMHLLPRNVYPLPAGLERAYAQTEALVLETDPAALETPEMQASMVDAGVTGLGLRKEIGADLYARVQKQAQSSELPGTVCDRFKPWFCALSLTLVEFQRAGMDPDSGIDRYFHRRAVKDKRPIAWLESPQAQFALFSGMSDALSEQFLASALDDLGRPEWQPEALVKLWRENRTAELETLIDSTRDEFPDAHARLLTDRNRAWIPPLAQRLRGDTPQLVVVGAAHLVGHDNVVSLLREQGFEVNALP